MEYGRGHKVTWDCVWFGSYPQTEVVPESAEYASAEYENLIKDDQLYNKLENQPEEEWDEFGNITAFDKKYRVGDTMINGEKYRRVRGFVDNKAVFFYFKYQPIKWRVLSVDGSEAFLLADKLLDWRGYRNERTGNYIELTWEKSDIRSWLNGYNADENIDNISYLEENFIDKAFSVSEQSLIKESDIENKDNLLNGADSGNDTPDKIFLLSESEAATDEANKYGFITQTIYDTDLEARDYGKRCLKSFYTHCVCYDNSGRYDHMPRSYGDDWLLRTSGMAIVTDWGTCLNVCQMPCDQPFGVRPALNLKLNMYSYAGTVCSNGTMSEVESGTVFVEKPDNIPEASPSTEPEYPSEIDRILSNPIIEKNSNIVAGNKVTWDCVWFGCYPQAEVVPEDVEYKIFSGNLIEEGDLIKDSDLYNSLKSQPEEEWDEFGDTEIGGEKYRRITSEDATFVHVYDYWQRHGKQRTYNWEDKQTFHYFKYQPIKWRVLSVNDSELFLLADKVLDCREYNDIDYYLNDNFIDTAFNVYEQSVIKERNLANENILNGKSDITDRVFLLSTSDMEGEAYNKYGLISNLKISASRPRCSKSSVFAKAMGVTSSAYNKNCYWYLNKGYVEDGGVFHSDMKKLTNIRIDIGIRPALNINLNEVSSNIYSYAGIRCSDGTMREVKPASTPETSPTVKPSEEPASTPEASPEVKPSEEPASTPEASPEVKPSEEPVSTPEASPEAKPSKEPVNTPEVKPTPTSSLASYDVSIDGSGGTNNSNQILKPTASPTISPNPTASPKATVTPEPTASAAPTPDMTETDNKPSSDPSTQTNAAGSATKPDEENSNGSDASNSVKKTKITAGSKVTDTKTKAVYKVTENGDKNTVQYVKNTKKNASSVTIPNKVKVDGKSYKVVSIGKNAFKDNKKLKKIKIGKNVKKIGKSAFSGCKNLTNVEMGDNVTNIKANAFSKCTSLTIITIPAKVNNIGDRAFYKCKSLQYILVKSNKLSESNIGKDVFSGGYSSPRIKTDKSKWKLYQSIFTSRGMSSEALYVIDPVKLVI